MRFKQLGNIQVLQKKHLVPPLFPFTKFHKFCLAQSEYESFNYIRNTNIGLFSYMKPTWCQKMSSQIINQLFFPLLLNIFTLQLVSNIMWYISCFHIFSFIFNKGLIWLTINVCASSIVMSSPLPLIAMSLSWKDAVWGGTFSFEHFAVCLHIATTSTRDYIFIMQHTHMLSILIHPWPVRMRTWVQF